MSERRWTVRDVLAWTADLFARQGLEHTARLDAELLMAKILGCDRVGVYLNYDRPLSAEERAAMRSLVVRRSRGEPVAYLLGHKEFYGLELAVDERVLIPRPETEILVDEALARLPADAAGPVVDVGSGSGAIALALAHARPRLMVLAVEIEAGAAALCRSNAVALGLAERVLVLRGDLLGPLLPDRVSLIVSNPPYVARNDPRLQPAVARYEPKRALFAGPSGLDVIRELLHQGAALLAPDGLLLLEIGEGQDAAVRELGEDAGFSVEAVRPDLAGIPRVVVLRAR